MAGPTALIAFIDLLEKSFPNIGREKFWGFPLFRIFLLALPVDDTREKGDAVGGGGASAVGLIGPLHAATHGVCLQFAACDGFAGETFGLFHPFFFGFRRPVVPRFAKRRVFARKVNGGDVIGWKRLGNRVFALGNVNVNHSRGFVVSKNESDDLFAAADIQGDVATVIEGSLEGMSTRCGVGTGEGRALDRSRLMRR